MDLTFLDKKSIQKITSVQKRCFLYVRVCFDGLKDEFT
jgi:hypothetical protein